jgi:hypothetical protein
MDIALLIVRYEQTLGRHFVVKQHVRNGIKRFLGSI